MATTQGTCLGMRILITERQRWRCACAHCYRQCATPNNLIQPLTYSSLRWKRISRQAFSPIAFVRTMFGRLSVKSSWPELRAGSFLAIVALPTALALGIASPFGKSCRWRSRAVNAESFKIHSGACSSAEGIVIQCN